MSVANAPAGAPGCFAAASVFSHDSKICQSCPVFENCSKASIETLERIKGLVDVEDLLKRHRVVKARSKAQRKPGVIAETNKFAEASTEAINEREQPKMPELPVQRTTEKVKMTFELDEVTKGVVGRLAVKPRDLAIVLCKRGMLDLMKVELSAGRNPFATAKPEFMRVVCDGLLNGGFTRAQLKQTFINRLSWSDGTASSHVAIACALLIAFGIVQENNDTLALSPALGK